MEVEENSSCGDGCGADSVHGVMNGICAEIGGKKEKSPTMGASKLCLSWERPRGGDLDERLLCSETQ